MWKAIIAGLLVILAVYIFILMISSIDFRRMSFSEIKLIVSICVGVAVTMVSANMGMQIVTSSVYGFVGGVLIYVLIQILLQTLGAH